MERNRNLKRWRGEEWCETARVDPCIWDMIIKSLTTVVLTGVSRALAITQVPISTSYTISISLFLQKGNLSPYQISWCYSHAQLQPNLHHWIYPYWAVRTTGTCESHHGSTLFISPQYWPLEHTMVLHGKQHMLRVHRAVTHGWAI